MISSQYKKNTLAKFMNFYKFFALLNYEFLMMLFTIMVVPHFFFVSLRLSSLALGLMGCAFFLLLYDYRVVTAYRFEGFERLILGLVICILVGYGCLGFLSSGGYKPLFSSIIIVCIIMPFSVYTRFVSVDFKSIYIVFIALTMLIGVLGWYSVFFSVEMLNYELLNKNVFPFSEPSHYALSLGLLSVSLVPVSCNLICIFLILNCFVLSLVFPNLVLLVFSFMGALLYTIRFKISFFIYSFILCIIAIFCVFVKNEYFISRIDFFSLDHLSALVWLQGWELACVNFVETYGVGLGLNSLGLPGTVFSTITERINELYGFNSNIYDGGFLASKIIAEFGLIGLFVILAYMYWVCAFVLRIKKMYKEMRCLDIVGAPKLCIVKKEILFSTVLLSFSVELFLRGYGYFSPGLVLAVASLWYLSCNRKALL